ncbi:hypothetical protein [Streptomyces sp. NPDC001743]|uniref:hypothetical protein n=1 Tax=Streptomyces sp. NPDC001743 TaxID=3154397 RepID=UPI003325DA7B
MPLTRITLSTGRSIELTELRMSSTYGGLLEGYPCKPVNDMKVSGVRGQAEQAFPSSPIHLVPPRREYPDQPDSPARAFGPVEVLPPVACTGLFRSAAIGPELNPVLHRSTLTVVWFQDTPDVPSGEEADLALRSIDWDELAQDYEL